MLNGNSCNSSGSREVTYNQDGTLSGGYLSISNGRYRIIIDDNNTEVPNSDGVKVNEDCANSTNGWCNNSECPSSTNKIAVGTCVNKCCTSSPMKNTSIKISY